MLLSLLFPICCIIKSVKFDQQCSGYIKQAADANTPELALERINIAIDYIERNGLTKGYTSVLWRTEDENVGFWYRNIKACQKELSDCIGGTQLEKSNVLMKAHEALTDDDGKPIAPPGISRFPNNLFWGFWLTISFGSLLFLFIIL